MRNHKTTILIEFSCNFIWTYELNCTQMNSDSRYNKRKLKCQLLSNPERATSKEQKCRMQSQSCSFPTVCLTLDTITGKLTSLQWFAVSCCAGIAFSRFWAASYSVFFISPCSSLARTAYNQWNTVNAQRFCSPLACIAPLVYTEPSNVNRCSDKFKCVGGFVVQGVHKVLHTSKIFISQKPHKVETLHFRQWIILP